MGIFRKKTDLKYIPKDENIEYWKSIYKNCPDWLKYEYATLQGRKHTRIRKSFKGAKLVCSELVDLMFSERPEKILSEDIQAIFDRSGWDKNVTTFAEKSLAFGGNVLKLYANESKELIIDFVDADKFIPISWDNDIITEADFLSYSVKDGKKYLTVESHRKEDKGYNIKQRVYKVGSGAGVSPCTPAEAGLNFGDSYEDGVFVKTNYPLFSFFKLPEANNICLESPRSIAIFANSTDTLQGLDIAFDALQQEIVLGRKRIIVPSQAIRTVTDENGNRVKYFDPSDEVFTAFEGDDKDQLKITDNTVELRIDDLRLAVQTYLDILSIQTGFSSGHFSFDGSGGMKTATEVISDNSKTHRTKTGLQESLSFCIDGIMKSIEGVAPLYNVTVGEFKYKFQDNIIEDRNSKTAYWVGRLNSKISTLEEVLMALDGLTEEESKEKADKIREQNATIDTSSLFGGLDN